MRRPAARDLSAGGYSGQGPDTEEKPRYGPGERHCQAVDSENRAGEVPTFGKAVGIKTIPLVHDTVR